MTIIGLDHVLLAIPLGAEAQARSFYCEVLSFREIEKPAALAGRGGLWLRSGSAVLHLGAEADFKPPKRAHPAFLVDDLEALERRLAASGAELVHDVPLPGYRRVHVKDPFGNRLELMQRVEEARE